MVAQMITKKNSGPLSLGPIPGGRLKNLKDIDKWSSLSLCLSVMGMSVTWEFGLYLCSWMGHIIALWFHVVHGGIVRSINTKYKYSQNIRKVEPTSSLSHSLVSGLSSCGGPSSTSLCCIWSCSCSTCCCCCCWWCCWSCCWICSLFCFCWCSFAQASVLTFF